MVVSCEFELYSLESGVAELQDLVEGLPKPEWDQQRIVVVTVSCEFELDLVSPDVGELQDLAIALVSDLCGDYSGSQMKHPSKPLVSVLLHASTRRL